VKAAAYESAGGSSLRE